MQLLYKVKESIYDTLIINEWIKNGEFENADKVIIAGTRAQAVMVKLLFRGRAQKIYYCGELRGEYKHSCLRKWIVFNKSYRSILPWNDTSILWIPDL